MIRPLTQNLSAAKLNCLLVVALLSVPVLFTAACARLPTLARHDVQHNSHPLTEQINVNTASAAELEKLPGVGKAIAERIVAHREQYGLFRRTEHLMMVRGISDNKFRQLRSLVTVDPQP
ncbi:MAG TPA: helix-hairpin-helix domain-containing protein [Pyrinomonadaceae bacterium]|jgi:competence ComEA-like helix-hairpin-helix protein